MEFESDADLSIDEPLTFDVPSESSIRRYGACLECQLRHIKCKQLVLDASIIEFNEILNA